MNPHDKIISNGPTCQPARRRDMDPLRLLPPCDPRGEYGLTAYCYPYRLTADVLEPATIGIRTSDDGGNSFAVPRGVEVALSLEDAHTLMEWLALAIDHGARSRTVHLIAPVAKRPLPDKP